MLFLYESEMKIHLGFISKSVQAHRQELTSTSALLSLSLVPLYSSVVFLKISMTAKRSPLYLDFSSEENLKREITSATPSILCPVCALEM